MGKSLELAFYFFSVWLPLKAHLRFLMAPLSSSKSVIQLMYLLSFINFMVCLSRLASFQMNAFLHLVFNASYLYAALFHNVDMVTISGVDAIVFLVLPLCISYLSLLTHRSISRHDIVNAITPFKDAFLLNHLKIFRLSLDFVLTLMVNSAEHVKLMASWSTRTVLTLYENQQTPFSRLGDDIYALQTSSNPAMAKKGDLLLEIWHGIARDLASGQSLDSLLNKPYPVTLGYLSFNQVKQHPYEQPKRFSLFFTADTRLVSTQGLSLT